ncbi:S8 family peptidase [Salinarimonas ramus]|uniref:Peptidase S8/S53 domain-containing protein n=1 Tax=Salinarimonas ramus TaxID=690164 RepID=A0A917Q4I2_9HYPH|nr:S8 family serine peptidase [Salinarimonas ramus]GGK22177.1 hypothetical protein GCM10011322_06050 [Salinarimonas ramus]
MTSGRSPDGREDGGAFAPKRFKIMFPNAQAFDAATAIETPGTTLVRSRKRAVLSVDLDPRAIERGADRRIGALVERFGARIVEDFRYDMEPVGPFGHELFEPEDEKSPSLDNVLDRIGAREAWRHGRGSGVIIAVVDTGIDGTRPEFSPSRRRGAWQTEQDEPWTDWDGHGTMCAAIAAGSRADGGLFDGVAPEAMIVACKTSFYDGELAAIYDYLAELATSGETVIATNSFGFNTGTMPTLPPGEEFTQSLDDAIAAGVIPFFSAGNNHALAGGRPDACSPTSIWLHKSWSSVMSVGTTDLDDRMWYYSSRGPGQFFGAPETNAKPDVVAPTPKRGRILYGDRVQTLRDGWGSSGACPQAAGLAALLHSASRNLSRDRTFDLIRRSARDLSLAFECQGHGSIDCAAAMNAVLASSKSAIS